MIRAPSSAAVCDGGCNRSSGLPPYFTYQDFAAIGNQVKRPCGSVTHQVGRLQHRIDTAFDRWYRTFAGGDRLRGNRLGQAGSHGWAGANQYLWPLPIRNDADFGHHLTTARRYNAMDQAEFDQYADAYYDQHAKNISLSGENPDSSP